MTGHQIDRFTEWAESLWDRMYRRSATAVYRAPAYRRPLDVYRARRCGCWQGNSSAQDEDVVRNFDDAFQDKRTVYVVVHGTFARHANWAREGSLRERLEHDGAVVTFCWSGRNRLRDRLEAAQSLRQLLLALQDARPDAHIGVVAHSHGGNVALDALAGKTASLEDRARLAEVRLVTLGTPFLSLTPRPLPRPARFLATGALMLVAFVPASLLVSLVLAPFAAPSSDTGSGTPPTSSSGGVEDLSTGDVVSISLLLLTCSVLLIWLSWSLLSYARRWDAPRLWEIISALSVRRESVRVTSPNGLSDGRLLALRQRGDEASGLLAAGSVAAWLSTMTLQRLRILAVTLVLFGLGLTSVAFRALGVPWLAAPLEWATTAAIFMVTASVVLGLGALLLLLFANAAFGSDAIFLSFSSYLDAEPVPSADTRVVFVRRSDFGIVDTLRHGVYWQPHAIELVEQHLSWSGDNRPDVYALMSEAELALVADVPNWNAAEAALSRALAAGGEPAQILARRADVRLRKTPQDVDGAAVDLFRAAAAASTNAELHALATNVQLQSSVWDAEQAEVSIARAVELAGDAVNATVEAVRAQWEALNGNNVAAAHHAQRALEADPQHAYARTLRAEVCLAIGRITPAQALEELSWALDDDASCLVAVRARSQLRLRVPREDGSATGWEDANDVVRRNPLDPYGYLIRATHTLAEEDANLEQVIEDLSIALDLAPFWPLPYELRARVYLLSTPPRRTAARRDLTMLRQLSEGLPDVDALEKQFGIGRQPFMERVKRALGGEGVELPRR